MISEQHEERIKRETLISARLMANFNMTVIEIAEIIGVPKSTVHWRLRNRLKSINSELFYKVDTVLLMHKARNPLYKSNPSRQ